MEKSPGMFGEYAYSPSKYQMALVAEGKWSVRNPPPLSLSSVAVKPHSLPGSGPKLHISTTRRSPGLAGTPLASRTLRGPLRQWPCESSQYYDMVKNIDISAIKIRFVCLNMLFC